MRADNKTIIIGRVLLFLLCLAPLQLLLWDAVQQQLGANPVEALLHRSGEWALRLLLATLAVTPLRRVTGWGWLLRFRRMLGLYAFFYALFHFVVYLWLDRGLSWGEIGVDLLQRPYISIGFAALLILLALAATSTKGVMRRLGRRWTALHQWVYAAGLFSVIHYLWLVKSDYREPGLYAAIFLLLMLFRMGQVKRRLQHRFRVYFNAPQNMTFPESRSRISE
ncbi:MAG: protein-methionine-sulfoxide reductase heme-binding subunit MsrQ [Pseudomonadota bacterium]